MKTLRSVLGALEKAKVDVESVSLKDPTLDDVFLKLTGHKAAAKSNGKNKKEKVGA